MEVVIENKISLKESNKIVTDIFESSYQYGDPTHLHYMKNPWKKFFFKTVLGTLVYRYQFKVFKVYMSNKVIAYLFTEKISDELAICIDMYVPEESRGKGLSKLILELYRKELYKEGYSFCMGASFYKNTISYAMLKKNCQADFFYENGFSYKRKSIGLFKEDIHFHKVSNKDLESVYFNISSDLIEDFTTLPVTNGASQAAAGFTWGNKIDAINIQNETIGYICYEILNNTIYLKLALKKEYWEHAPEITNSYCEYKSLIPQVVVVQYPTNIEIQRCDIEKVSPTLLFCMFETLGGEH